MMVSSEGLYQVTQKNEQSMNSVQNSPKKQ